MRLLVSDITVFALSLQSDAFVWWVLRILAPHEPCYFSKDALLHTEDIGTILTTLQIIRYQFAVL